MKNKNKVLNTLADDINQMKGFDDKLVVLISDLYKDRILESERENRFMLEKLITATQGKELILENNSRK